MNLRDDFYNLETSQSPKVNQATAMLTVVFVIIGNLSATVGHLGVTAMSYNVFIAIWCLGFKKWELLPTFLLYILLVAYWRVIPEGMSGLPVLPFLLPFIVCSLILLAIPPTRNYFSQFRLGEVNRSLLLLTLATGLISTAALIIWAKWTNNLGIGVEMMRGFSTFPKWLIFGFGIPIFALVNALAEELVYRGVIMPGFSSVFKQPGLVNLCQASLFAAVHFAVGFPNGVVGYLMVLVYALALGYLRQNTKGLLAPYLAHVVADLTIGYFLASSI